MSKALTSHGIRNLTRDIHRYERARMDIPARSHRQKKLLPGKELKPWMLKDE
jgi:hypothetical protein